jgi:hypothetical protein
MACGAGDGPTDQNQSTTISVWNKSPILANMQMHMHKHKKAAAGASFKVDKVSCVCL